MKQLLSKKFAKSLQATIPVLLSASTAFAGVPCGVLEETYRPCSSSEGNGCPSATKCPGSSCNGFICTYVDIPFDRIRNAAENETSEYWVDSGVTVTVNCTVTPGDCDPNSSCKCLESESIPPTKCGPPTLMPVLMSTGPC